MRLPRSPVRLSDAAAGISRTTRPPPAAPTVTPPRPCQPNGMISIPTQTTVRSILDSNHTGLFLFIDPVSICFPWRKGDPGTEGFVQLDSSQQELENFHEIISEVYANNHQELAPCLDGLGAEALQEAASSATFSQMNFQGSG